MIEMKCAGSCKKKKPEEAFRLTKTGGRTKTCNACITLSSENNYKKRTAVENRVMKDPFWKYCNGVK